MTDAPNRRRTLAALLVGAAWAVAGALPACGGAAADDTSGDLRIEAEVEGGAPRVGENTVHIRVSDAAGAAVTGAAVTLEPWMPAHGHGSPSKPELVERGGGLYDATGLELHMPGEWEILIRAEKGEVFGEVTLRWDVGG